ncbi:MAG: hypothetical protein CO013_10420 [Syntrophobacterales bacterium CG_4_8_14_3_um_filter_58_8]|nr:MAG: hypothetical protein CO013_10420 [Syntrophobacterales bacterium CG_4_8_14_3_um_filter_58_8]
MFHYIIKCFQWANLTRLLNIGDYIPRQRSFILLFLAVFTICLYCNVKFSLAFDEAPKFSGGAFNHVNRSAESWEITFIPPGAYNGIYAFECSKDFTSKSSGGICKNFSLFEFSGDNAIEKGGEQNRDDDDTEFLKYVQLFVVLPCCIWLFMSGFISTQRRVEGPNV